MGVYVIGGASGGPLKVGYAIDAERRLAALQTSSPLELVVRKWWPEKSKHDERDLHLSLARYRIRGEWFLPVPPVLMVLELYREIGELPDRWLDGYHQGRRDESDDLALERAELRRELRHVREAGVPGPKFCPQDAPTSGEATSDDERKAA